MRSPAFWRLVLLATWAAGLVVLAGACGAAEEPTATPTKAPAVAPTPTTAAPGATPTATRPAVVATPTAAPTATPTPSAKQPKKGGALRANLTSTPAALDVLQTTTSGETSVMNPIYDGFFTVTPQWAFQPALAQSWDLAGDSKSITLHLAKGVKFHDGTPFNAAAVKSHFEYILNPDNRFDQRLAVAAITSVDVLGEYDVRLNMANPDAVVVPNLAARPGWVYSPTYRDATPKAERKTKGVGAGSFKVVQFLPDSHITFEPWASGFSGGKYPYLDRLTGTFITDPAVLLASYRANDLEVFSPTDDQVALLKNDKTTILASRWQAEWSFLSVNPRFKPLDDVRVRRAISMAIDRESALQALYAGDGTPAYGVVGPAWSWCWDPSYKKYAYDATASKKLLADAGFSNGFTVGKFVWFGKEGTLPKATLLADMLKKVGITLELQMIDSAQASREYRIDMKHAAYTNGIGWGTGAPDMDTAFRDWFYSKSAGYLWNGYLDPALIKQIDDALDKGRGTLDFQERCKSYRVAQDIIAENQLGVSLFPRRVKTAQRDYVKDLWEFPAGGGYNWFMAWLDK